MTRVLLYEPQESVRAPLAARIAALDHPVLTADSTAATLDAVRSGQCDIVLAFADPSDAEADSLCRELRVVASARPVPIVLYSSGVIHPDRERRLFAAGCDALFDISERGALERWLAVMSRAHEREAALLERNRELLTENQRLDALRQRRLDSEHLASAGGTQAQRSLARREAAATKPDALLLVDGRGRVAHWDRGASELFGPDLAGRSLGSLTPSSGLEAFVRNARSDARTGFRFEVATRPGWLPRGSKQISSERPRRTLAASVMPVSAGADAMRVVILVDPNRAESTSDWSDSGPRVPRRHLDTLLEAARSVYSLEAIIGSSPEAEVLRRNAAELCHSTRPVLISGEQGVGKSFLARVLHFGGNRIGPFLDLSCRGRDEEAVRAELFGQDGGMGLMQAARDGTLFLDGLEGCGLDLQRELLRALEEGVPGARRGPFAGRLLASSRSSPEELLRRGELLPELREGFRGSSLSVPPLRLRGEDAGSFAEVFLEELCPDARCELADEILALIRQHTWPGNLVELRDVISEAFLAAGGEAIEIEHLPQELRQIAASEVPALLPAPRAPRVRPRQKLATPLQRATAPGPAPEQDVSAPRAWEITDKDPVSLDLYQKKAILRALDMCQGDKLAAARMLGLGKSTLYRKLKRFGLS